MKVCPACKLVFNHEPLPKCLRCGGTLEDWHNVLIMTSSTGKSSPSDSANPPIAATASAWEIHVPWRYDPRRLANPAAA